MKIKHQDIRRVDKVDGNNFFIVYTNRGTTALMSRLPRQVVTKMAMLDVAAYDNGEAVLFTKNTLWRRRCFGGFYSPWLYKDLPNLVCYSFITSKHIDWELCKQTGNIP